MPAASPIMKRLVQVPIFRDLTETEAASLFEIAEEATLAKGASLFQEGEKGDAMYVVLEGHVDVLKKDRSGAQQSG